MLRSRSGHTRTGDMPMPVLPIGEQYVEAQLAQSLYWPFPGRWSEMARLLPSGRLAPLSVMFQKDAL